MAAWLHGQPVCVDYGWDDTEASLHHTARAACDELLAAKRSTYAAARIEPRVVPAPAAAAAAASASLTGANGTAARATATAPCEAFVAAELLGYRRAGGPYLFGYPWF
jgi:hypothetical protein